MITELRKDIAYKPEMTDAGLDASAAVTAVDEFCKIRTSYIAAERPLTIYLDKREIVTVMTLMLMGFVGAVEIRLDWDRHEILPAISRLSEACDYLLAHLDRYDLIMGSDDELPGKLRALQQGLRE